MSKVNLIWDRKLKLAIKQPAAALKLREQVDKGTRVNREYLYREVGTNAEVSAFYELTLDALENLVAEGRALEKEVKEKSELGAHITIMQVGNNFSFVYKVARAPTLAELAAVNAKKEKKLELARKRKANAEKLIEELEKDLEFKG